MNRMYRWAGRCIVVIFICLMGMMLSFSDAGAQALVRMEIPSSPNPVGSGARALGMGGAFIAVADDATAASWNPGGLIQLEKPEISAVGGYVYRRETNTFGSNPEAYGRQSTDNLNLNYLSAAYPFKALGHNMIVSLNYQRLYDFYRNWNFNLNMGGPPFVGPVQYSYDQSGALYALGLAYSIQITPALSAGLTLNYWGDTIIDNKWEQKYHQVAQIQLGPFPGTATSQKTEKYAFEGWNANLGFLWRMTEHWTLGGVFKTPFTADVTHDINSQDSTVYPTFPAANTSNTVHLRSKDKLDMPMSYGLGLAYRFSDRFTMSGDVYRTHWEDFIYKSAQGPATSPISGMPEATSNVKTTTWFRLGGEYLFIGDKFVVPVRAGIFYDPAPAEGSPDDYCGFSVGTGIAYGRFVFDIAYQFRFGFNVGSSMLQGARLTQDVIEHTVYSSLIIHF